KDQQIKDLEEEITYFTTTIEDLNNQLNETEKKVNAIDEEMWKSGLPSSDVNSCIFILSKIRNTKSCTEKLEEIEWNDIKTQYENSNKKEFIKNFKENWFSKHPKKTSEEKGYTLDENVSNDVEFAELIKNKATVLASDNDSDASEDDTETKKYPTVNFDNLSNRILKLKDILLKIAKNEDVGYFHQLAVDIITNVGVAKSHTLMIQYNTFNQLMPGYYGPKGLIIIFETLKEIFMDIISNHCAPQTEFQFLHDVLVPETTVRLIIEVMDLNVDMMMREIL
ncbi:34520_t:CDS:2, partial [Racocetra persica]